MIKHFFQNVFRRQKNNNGSLNTAIDLYSADFFSDFYTHYHFLYTYPGAIFFQKSNCYGIFQYNLVKDILNDSANFSSRHLQKVDKILVGADHKTHTNHKKIIYSKLSMLHSNNAKDFEIIEQILNIIFAEILNQKNQEVNIIDWLVNPFVFTYIIRRMELNNTLYDMDILNEIGNYQDKIIAIKKVFDNLNLVHNIAESSIQSGRISDELKSIINTIGINGGYSEDDFIAFLRLLILAGIETTSSFIASSIFLLHKEAVKLDIANLKLHRGKTTELLNEVLRYFSPAQFTFRITERDVNIGQAKVPANSLLAVSIGAANRDPSIFTEPNDFIPGRKPKHIAFGLSKHHCIGEELAFTLAENFILKYLCYEQHFSFDKTYTTKNSIFSFKIDTLNAKVI